MSPGVFVSVASAARGMVAFGRGRNSSSSGGKMDVEFVVSHLSTNRNPWSKAPKGHEGRGNRRALRQWLASRRDARRARILTGGVALLNHRLRAEKPPASSLWSPRLVLRVGLRLASRRDAGWVRIRSGGVALLNHRLRAEKPSASSMWPTLLPEANGFPALSQGSSEATPLDLNAMPNHEGILKGCQPASHQSKYRSSYSTLAFCKNSSNSSRNVFTR